MAVSRWDPSRDLMYEVKDKFVVALELPGIPPKDVDLTIEEAKPKQITIKATG